MNALSSTASSLHCPLSVVRIENSDPDEQARDLGFLEQHYEQLSAGPFHGSILLADFSDMILFEERLSQSVYQVGCSPPGQLTIAVGCELSSEAYWNGRHVLTDTAVVFAPAREFELRSPLQTVCVGLSVRASALQRMIAEAQLGGIDSLFLSRDCWADARPGTQRLRHRIAGILDIVRGTPEVFSEGAARRQVISELTEDLCSLFAHPAPPGRVLRADSYPRLARRARDLIVRQFEDPPSVEEICAAIGCSRRALQYAFHHVYGVNPLAYLRALRLNAVRRALMRPETGTRVQDVAGRHGFWHLPRFAQQYSAMFGELPSHTLASHRIPHAPSESNDSSRVNGRFAAARPEFAGDRLAASR